MRKLYEIVIAKELFMSNLCGKLRVFNEIKLVQQNLISDKKYAYLSLSSAIKHTCYSWPFGLDYLLELNILRKKLHPKIPSLYIKEWLNWFLWLMEKKTFDIKFEWKLLNQSISVDMML